MSVYICEKYAKIVNLRDIPRQRIFSIGDFWWIEQCHHRLNDQGTSCILVNNQEAKRYALKQ